MRSTLTAVLLCLVVGAVPALGQAELPSGWRQARTATVEPRQQNLSLAPSNAWTIVRDLSRSSLRVRLTQVIYSKVLNDTQMVFVWTETDSAFQYDTTSKSVSIDEQRHRGPAWDGAIAPRRDTALAIAYYHDNADAQGEPSRHIFFRQSLDLGEVWHEPVKQVSGDVDYHRKAKHPSICTHSTTYADTGRVQVA